MDKLHRWAQLPYICEYENILFICFCLGTEEHPYGANNIRFAPLKGTVAPDFVGPLLACMNRYMDEKRNGFWVLHFSVALSIFGGHFKVSCQNISEIPGISEMDLQMWAAVLGDCLFPFSENH